MCNAPVRISEEVAVVRNTTGDSGEKMLAVHRGPERHRTVIVSETADSATSFLKKFATLSRLFLCRGLYCATARHAGLRLASERRPGRSEDRPLSGTTSLRSIFAPELAVV